MLALEIVGFRLTNQENIACFKNSRHRDSDMYVCWDEVRVCEQPYPCNPLYTPMPHSLAR